MRRIVHCSNRVPDWLIRAAGFEPEMYQPGRTIPDGPVPDIEGVCPFARMFVNDTCRRDDTDGIVFTTECDQMRRSAEFAGSIKPVFLMNVPATVTEHGSELYADEVERLAGFLVNELGGTMPAPETLRSVIERRPDETGRAAAEGAGRNKVMLLGGHVCVPVGVFRTLLDDYALDVVAETLSQSGRGLDACATTGVDSAALVRSAAKMQFQDGCDIHQRPNNKFHSVVRSMVDELNPDGVVLLRQTWCDRWYLEMLRFRETLGISLLDVELNGPSIDARAVCRVQAFAESLAG